MDFSTRIDIPKGAFLFSYNDRILLLGSCFAENIGNKLTENKFKTDINPFGTLYNPASVAMAIRRLMQPEMFTGSDLFRHGGCYHSFAHHSRFSSPSETECLERINNRLSGSSAFLQEATRLVVTLGTAYVYRLKSSGQVVANCHKLPEKQFDRSLLPVETIVADWQNLLSDVWRQNPALKVLFTVSPIRHWKDGAHGNQLSKATLLLAVDRLQQAFLGQIGYFPAYELMMDELRDYRFYADDMLHPSVLAIEYIWQRFIESQLSAEASGCLKEWQEIRKAILHKPFQPRSEGYRQFMLQTLLKIERINEKIPSFAAEEENELKKRLKQFEYGI